MIPRDKPAGPPSKRRWFTNKRMLWIGGLFLLLALLLSLPPWGGW
jgi:hypothetical protein